MPKAKKIEKEANQADKYDKFDLANAISTTDCTGLIPTPPLNEEELESYMDIYDFQPPNLTQNFDKSTKHTK